MSGYCVISTVDLEIFNVKIFSLFVLATNIQKSENYSQQNLDHPKNFCTVISMYPSSSCVMSILRYVCRVISWIQEAPSPRFYCQDLRDHWCQQASKCNTSPQPEKMWTRVQQIVTTPTVLLSACTLVSMGLPYVLVDMIASHTRMLGYFSCIFSHACQNAMSAHTHVQQIKFLSFKFFHGTCNKISALTNFCCLSDRQKLDALKI